MQLPFHKILNNTLSLWFGDRFITEKRGDSIKIKMKGGNAIPVTLQLILSSGRKVSRSRKSIQKSEDAWHDLISAITEGKGQERATKWISYLHGKDTIGEEFTLSISDVHFSFLAKEVSEHIYHMADFNLLEGGERQLKNEIWREEGGINYRRAERLMDYEGTPKYTEIILNELEEGKVGNASSSSPVKEAKKGNTPQTPFTSSGGKGVNTVSTSTIEGYIEQAKAVLAKKH